jgi:hypothetical protein
MVATKPDQCPECQGEVTFGYGLAGGSDPNGDPTHYYMCLDCDWMSSKPKETICFPHGLMNDNKGIESDE